MRSIMVFIIMIVVIMAKVIHNADAIETTAALREGKGKQEKSEFSLFNCVRISKLNH